MSYIINYVSTILSVSTFGAGHCSTDTEAFVIISDRTANAVAVLTQSTTTIVGHAFAIYATVFTLVLNSKVQAVNQTEEVGVTVGREAVTTLLHEVVRTVGVTTEFWQYVGPGSYVINNAVVTTVVERTHILEFQTCECHTGPGVVFVFSAVALDLIFPLAVTGQLVSNLSFTFEAKTHVGLVAIYRLVVREIVQAVYFTVQI